MGAGYFTYVWADACELSKDQLVRIATEHFRSDAFNARIHLRFDFESKFACQRLPLRANGGEGDSDPRTFGLTTGEPDWVTPWRLKISSSYDERACVWNGCHLCWKFTTSLFSYSWLVKRTFFFCPNTCVSLFFRKVNNQRTKSHRVGCSGIDCSKKRFRIRTKNQTSFQPQGFDNTGRNVDEMTGAKGHLLLVRPINLVQKGSFGAADPCVFRLLVAFSRKFANLSGVSSFELYENHKVTKQKL